MNEIINENRNLSQQLTNIEEEVQMSLAENSQRLETIENEVQRLKTIENEVHLLKENINDLSLKGRKTIIYSSCRNIWQIS